MRKTLIVSLFLALTVPVFAQEKLDLEMLGRIRNEGFRHSQVMKTMSELTDRIGPRLTSSPNALRANEWTRDLMTQYGLTNAHLEKWGTYDRGWSQEAFWVRMTAPDNAVFIAYPKPWTPPTSGPVSGDAVLVKIEKKEDIENYRGKLGGKIVLLGEMREVKPQDKAALVRYNEDSLMKDVFDYKVPGDKPPFDKAAYRKRIEFSQAVMQFFEQEKALAVIEPSRAGDGGTVFVQAWRNQPWKSASALGVPSFVMDIEHYGRVVRLLDRNVPVRLEVNFQGKLLENVDNFDTVAEIPGTDPKLKDEVVMLGAHLDSWASATGATDNGAGSGTALEVVRILKALGIKPRRTIRIALWTGEEQGLLGSEGYVQQHFATFADPKDPSEKSLERWLRTEETTLTLHPEHAKLAAYFNVDNGTGKIRGIYTQENPAVVPIFESWIKPLADLGVTTVSNRNTGGTDHESYDDVGLPGFQFVQDEIEYDARTHHSNMDSYERLQADDMKQISVVWAWFVYNAAMRDEMLPRKPLPRALTPSAETQKLAEKLAAKKPAKKDKKN